MSHPDCPQPSPIATTLIPPRRWRSRRSWTIAGLCLVVVLAVIVGSLAWPSSSAVPAMQRAPFYNAVFNLANQPVVRYAGSAPGDDLSWDMEVTSDGEETGTVSVAEQQISILSVGGKTYFKLPQDLLGTLPSGVSSDDVSGKWITGDTDLADALPTSFGSPIKLAVQLWTDLDGVTDFPLVGAPTSQIEGVAALGVHTAAGELYVSARAPYRVLRLVPAEGNASPGTESSAWSSDWRRAQARKPAWTSAPARAEIDGPAEDGGVAADDPDSIGGQTDFEPMSTGADAQDLDQVIDDTKQLSSAIDVGVDFDFDQTGNLECSDSECTVIENVTTSTAAAQSSVKSLSGTVTAVMTASVTVNGQDGGSCSQTSTLPINGSGVMTCVDAGVAPVVAQIKQQAQEEADAQAAETGEDAEVPVSLDYEAEVEIEAEAVVQAEIEQLVSNEQDELDAAQEQARQDETQQGQPCSVDDAFASTASVVLASANSGPAGISARQCGGPVGVNSGGLANDAYNARVDSSFPSGPRARGAGGNVAAATVDVNGVPRTLVGLSNGNSDDDPIHSEVNIINQMNRLAAQGAQVGKITALYSERQPCFDCDAALSDYLDDNAVVTWSVPWTDNAVENGAANDYLMYLIQKAGGF